MKKILLALILMCTSFCFARDAIWELKLNELYQTFWKAYQVSDAIKELPGRTFVCEYSFQRDVISGEITDNVRLYCWHEGYELLIENLTKENLVTLSGIFGYLSYLPFDKSKMEKLFESGSGFWSDVVPGVTIYVNKERDEDFQPRLKLLLQSQDYEGHYLTLKIDQNYFYDLSKLFISFLDKYEEYMQLLIDNAI